MFPEMVKKTSCAHYFALHVSTIHSWVSPIFGSGGMEILQVDFEENRCIWCSRR